MEELEKVDTRIPSRLNEMATILSFDFDQYRIKPQLTEKEIEDANN